MTAKLCGEPHHRGLDSTLCDVMCAIITFLTVYHSIISMTIIFLVSVCTFGSLASLSDSSLPRLTKPADPKGVGHPRDLGGSYDSCLADDLAFSFTNKIGSLTHYFPRPSSLPHGQDIGGEVSRPDLVFLFFGVKNRLLCFLALTSPLL